MVNDKNGKVLIDEQIVLIMRKEYYKGLINEKMRDREREVRMTERESEYGRISKEEVR